MPIAGRPLPISETPKPRGAAFDPSAVYVCQQTLNTQGQPIAPVRGKVFAQALPSASPADFAVFGTQAANGPMRLPLGGTPREMIRDYPQLTQTEPTIQKVWLVSRGQGQNFATYRLSPRFRVVTRETDPQSGQLGWHFYNGTHPVDSFVGSDGSVWVLQQRHKPGPQPVNFGTTPIPPNDLFVLHFDKNLTLLQQTVVALGS